MRNKTEEIVQFLKDWKVAASSQIIDFVPRPKNIEGIKELGLTIRQARLILQSLVLENYVSGPVSDTDRQHDKIWVFGLNIESREVYIKIKLFMYQKILKAKCLSFHPAEYPLRYPFKGGDYFEHN